MKSRGKSLIFAAALLMAQASGHAEEWSGSFNQTIDDSRVAVAVQNDSGGDFSLLQPDVMVYFTWKVWSMMDEPVEDYRALWGFMHDGVTVQVSADYGRRVGLSKQAYRAPADVLRKVGIDIAFFGQVVDKGSGASYGLYVDPGIMLRPFIGSIDLLKSYKALSASDKGRYESFNCPGSPNWNNLFHDGDSYKIAYGKADYTEEKIPGLPRDEARRLMKTGFKTLLSVRCVRLRFDLSPIRDWLADQAKAEADSQKTASDKEASELAAQEKKLNGQLAALSAKKAERQKAAESSDFWDTSDDVESSGEREARALSQMDLDALKAKKNENAKKSAALADSLAGIAAEKNRANRDQADYSGAMEKRRASIDNRPKPGEKKAYRIGDTGPAGGIVFYDKGNDDGGWRYLECAPQDQSKGIQWIHGNAPAFEPNIEIGAGAANTQAIISMQGSGCYPAQICADFSFGGYDDWFLPSHSELIKMWQNLYKKNIGSFSDNVYWSSSQYGVEYARALEFRSGSAFLDDMDGTDLGYVRAIRAF